LLDVTWCESQHYAGAVAVLRSYCCHAWCWQDRRPRAGVSSTSFVMYFKCPCLRVSCTGWNSTVLPTDSHWPMLFA